MNDLHDLDALTPMTQQADEFFWRLGKTACDRGLVFQSTSSALFDLQENHPLKCRRNKHRNRAVFNDWGLYTFMQMLTYKCQKYGKDLHILDERNTSKMCSGCGNLQPMPLWKRTYYCTECGLVMDRDENSAVNILNRYITGLAFFLAWYLARLEPHTSFGECGVLQDVRSEVGIIVMPHPNAMQQLRLW